MKKGDIIEGVIEHYSFPNRGSFYYEETLQDGTISGKKIVVKGALPGQKVKARIIKKKQDRAEAMLLDVIETAPVEISRPLCTHFFECGGCTYQTFPYEEQLKLKEQMVKELLNPVVNFGDNEEQAAKGLPQIDWEGIFASPKQYYYRNKMEFTFGDSEKDGPLMVGLHRQHSNYDILGIDNCAIVNPAWNEILKFTQNFFRKHGVSFYHKMKHTGILRNLVIRESVADGSILINLVTTTSHDIGARAEAEKKAKILEQAEKVEQTKILEQAEEIVHSESDVQNNSSVEDDNSSANKKIKFDGVKEDKKSERRNEILEELHLPEYVAGLLSLGDGTGHFNSLSRYSKIAGILYTENDSFADAIIPESTTVLYGDDFLIEEVLGLKFKVSPFSFFQTNTKGCEVLYTKAREYALWALGEVEKQDTENGSVSKSGESLVDNKTDKSVESVIAKNEEISDDLKSKKRVIYDLYSGTGTIAQLMAPVADEVYGVEIIEEAVESAKANAKLNKLKNCHFIAGDVLKKLDELEEKPELIILDPPRDGLNPKALEKILKYGVNYMVYISCKPTSLARDLEIFEANGYVPIKGCAVDQFPNTQHVETVVLMSKVNPNK